MYNRLFAASEPSLRLADREICVRRIGIESDGRLSGLNCAVSRRPLKRKYCN
jgi:hypothetical protein